MQSHEFQLNWLGKDKTPLSVVGDVISISYLWTVLRQLSTTIVNYKGMLFNNPSDAYEQTIKDVLNA